MIGTPTVLSVVPLMPVPVSMISSYSSYMRPVDWPRPLTPLHDRQWEPVDVTLKLGAAWKHGSSHWARYGYVPFVNELPFTATLVR